MRQRIKRQAGYTLVEIIIAMLIAAILGLLAAPSLYAIRQETRVASATNRVQAIIGDARANAVKYQQDVRLCPIQGSWQEGLFTTTAENCPPGPDGDKTQRVVAFESGVSIDTKWPRTGVVFDKRGFVSSDDGIDSFAIDGELQAVERRLLTLATTGTTRLTRQEESTR